MATQNTLYIAEPIFSATLSRFDSEITFPPIKKIGITTDHPERREKELLGTMSPVKISIVKAWTNIDAKKVESMLHTLLDNTRLDGEYFWDGNETLVDAVSDFMTVYHPDAKEIIITDDPDAKAASVELNNIQAKRIASEVVPLLNDAGIAYKINKSEKGVLVQLGDYKLRIGAKTSDRYTLTIFSKKKSSEDALLDFVGSQELSSLSNGDTSRKARIPMSKIDTIMDSIKQYKDHLK